MILNLLKLDLKNYTICKKKPPISRRDATSVEYKIIIPHPFSPVKFKILKDSHSLYPFTTPVSYETPPFKKGG